MKFIFIFFLLVFINAPSFCQMNFSLSGKTNFVVNGKAVLRKVARGDFYRSELKNDTTNIVNHQFFFSGKLIFPELFRIYIFDSATNFLSELFFLDSGRQTINFDLHTIIRSSFDVGYGLSLTGSNADHEYANIYLPLFERVNKEMKDCLNSLDFCDTILNKDDQSECENNFKTKIKDIREIRNNIFYDYSMRNKRSPILPWLLYEATKRYGFKEIFAHIYDSTHQYYSKNVKDELFKIINVQKAKTVGQIFPLTELVMEKKSKDNQSKKFTLVEFWFSACKPCLIQFEQLRPIYNKYNKSGFDIVAISIDNAQSLKAYKKILSEKKYPWKQILDTGGIKTFSLNIEKFPTSILIDNKGKILSIDIGAETLISFLERNIVACGEDLK